ncbi:CAF17-like 4Fe-4S cluster assembly/insertion protein YgfZ [Parasphingorhabdus cellanae]|uniref:Folate-binding protein YgfZ n=1 Tax=Parasphingorhabdus cellanae TaxID=2806553 RepID=A0ABX7SZI2_9SPHN|nr:folate-binding protein YgfZ [Parasphingorhabdus cellanae]QTD54670.1 folate-binding protein YgfZ [Parasphingorhabdus cellanae]
MTETRLNERAVIRISATDGTEDISGFLQGLVTQDMQFVLSGTPQWAALLTAQGKVLFDFFLWADGRDILIDCEKDHAEALVKRLKLYRLRRKIGIEVDEGLSVHWSRDASGQPADPRLAEIGYRWIAHNDSGTGSVDAAYKAHRLALGVTEGQDELGSDKTLWLECNAAELKGVSFTKGCYVGQENTARMNYRQKVNRRLVVVPIAQADEKRQRIAYPDLGLSIEHRRVDDITDLDLPDWLETALAKQPE